VASALGWAAYAVLIASPWLTLILAYGKGIRPLYAWGLGILGPAGLAIILAVWWSTLMAWLGRPRHCGGRHRSGGGRHTMGSNERRQTDEHEDPARGHYPQAARRAQV
jgi:hypothetical protein